MKKVSFGQSIASDIYSGASDFGRSYAYIISAFVFVICLVAIIGGVYLIRRPSVFTAHVNFTITKVTPEVTIKTVTEEKTTKQIPTTIYNLEGSVEMCGNNTIILPGYQTYVVTGQTIKVWMKPNCESIEAHFSSDDTTVIGWVILIISLIAVIINILRIYFVRKYKGIAAVQGAAGVANIFKLI